jgi:acetoin utilization deacetylase AcuC-like enzyme
MPNLVYVHDEIFQRHQTPASHPESPKRLAAIEQKLIDTQLLGKVSQAGPRIADPDELCKVHNAGYIEELEKISARAKQEGNLQSWDADTFVSAESYDIAKLAVGAGFVAVDSLASGSHRTAFVAARPPGHHALQDRAMGFCLFNNVALAARYAQKLGMKKVLIIDWDVHHGNGTQAMFYNDPSVCFISFQQFPFWPPGWGWYEDDGEGAGKGFNINIPLPGGTGDRGYLKAWDTLVTPIALEYKPDIILLSAGYDAHQFDPLADQKISSDGFFLLSSRLVSLSETTDAPVAAFLEGGYNTRMLAESVAATIDVLNAGRDRDSLMAPGGKYGGETKAMTLDIDRQAVDERINTLKNYFAKYWQSLR